MFAVFIFIKYNNYMDKNNKVNLDEASLHSIADLMGGLLDKQTAILATKQELKEGLEAQTVELKAYIHEGVETVMEGMTEIDVRDRVDKLEKDVRQLKLNKSTH
jgi:hypothetical protein